MMQVLELLQLAKRHVLGGSNVEQCKNQAHNLSCYQVTLALVSKLVSKSV